PHVQRPLLLLAPSLLGQLSLGFERLPALRRHPVKIRMVPAHALRRAHDTRLPGRSHSVADDHFTAPCLVFCPRLNGCNCGIRAATRYIFPEITPRRDVISSAIACRSRAGPCTRITSMV